ncbi:MAG TPA: hypothetical protein DIC35_03360 [Candidatus Moranbacteria bacterium]|nr:hypothetical protein [Candidatus Moranbacteria bacterium]
MKDQKREKIFTTLLAIFIISAGFLFFDTTPILAASNTCTCFQANIGDIVSYATGDSTTAPTKEACEKKCGSNGGRYKYGTDFIKKGTSGYPFFTKSAGLIQEVKNDKEFTGAVGDAAEGAIMWLLQGVLYFTGWILNLAVLLFSKVIDANTASAMLSDPAIYEIWSKVRDLCNIGFILVLLFSAFSTVFQYSKYNYKNILLWLVIMALLVNFSFPITRFIIDISNSLMYTLLDNLMGSNKSGGEIITSISAFDNLQIIITDKKANIPQMLASIIFIFVLALTILALAFILLIRTIALGIIIIFSPIGFAGSIIGKGGEWWNNLFKYAMAGPIIALVLYISTQLMNTLAAVTNDVGFIGGMEAAPNNIVIGMTRFIPPIVILWIGMGMAVKGIDGAGSILGKVRGKGIGMAKSFGKGAWNTTGIPGGIKKGWENTRKSGKIFGMDNKYSRFLFKSGKEERESQIAGGVTGGKKGWKDASKNKRVEEFRKKYKEKADENDHIDAIGKDSLVHQILKADLHHKDPSKRYGEAVKVASMLHHLKTDTSKKDEFELKVRSEVLDPRNRMHATNMQGKNSEQKENYIKQQIALNWKVLNDKAKQAHKVAETNDKPTTPEINTAAAKARGVVDALWT